MDGRTPGGRAAAQAVRYGASVERSHRVPARLASGGGGAMRPTSPRRPCAGRGSPGARSIATASCSRRALAVVRAIAAIGCARRSFVGRHLVSGLWESVNGPTRLVTASAERRPDPTSTWGRAGRLSCEAAHFTAGTGPVAVDVASAPATPPSSPRADRLVHFAAGCVMIDIRDGPVRGRPPDVPGSAHHGDPQHER